MKIVFFELEEWEKDYLKQRIPNQDVHFFTEKVKDANIENVKDADIVATFVFSPFTKDVLDKFPNLKLLTTMSTGYDHIDLDECKRRGITVTNVPAYGDNTVAEHAFGLMLNLSRNIHKAYLRTSKENNFSYDGLIGFDLKGKTLGVLGTGRIGLNSIHIAKGFNMNIIAYDAFQRPELQEQYGFKYVELDELYRTSDIITIHVPLLKTTHHMINKESISKMKDGVLIINTARGPIIDTDALIEGLDSGKIGGVGLDVLEGELLIKDEKEIVHTLNNLPKEQMSLLLKNHSLMHRPNAIITPHLAFYSKEGMLRILDTTLENIYDLIEERGFKYEVKQ